MLEFNEVAGENVKAKEFARLKPGEEVAVKLEEVIATDDGHLDFRFVGTDPNNPGNFKPRFWASDFDQNDEKYRSDDVAKYRLEQLKHILMAYLSDEDITNIKGATWAERRASIMSMLTPDKYKDVETRMKLILKYNSDDDLTLPKYPDFISTAYRPKALKLRSATNQEGIPWERVKPLAEYGVEAPAGGEEAAKDLPFGASEEDKKEEPTPSFKQS